MEPNDEVLPETASAFHAWNKTVDQLFPAPIPGLAADRWSMRIDTRLFQVMQWDEGDGFTRISIERKP
jgi:hypothetical protein